MAKELPSFGFVPVLNDRVKHTQQTHTAPTSIDEGAQHCEDMIKVLAHDCEQQAVINFICHVVEYSASLDDTKALVLTSPDTKQWKGDLLTFQKKSLPADTNKYVPELWTELYNLLGPIAFKGVNESKVLEYGDERALALLGIYKEIQSKTKGNTVAVGDTSKMKAVAEMIQDVYQTIQDGFARAQELYPELYAQLITKDAEASASETL